MQYKIEQNIAIPQRYKCSENYNPFLDYTYDPQKYAWAETTKAIKRGELVRQPCEKCGAAKTSAHHDDYDRTLDVKWLCAKHHSQRHKELKQNATA